MKHTIRRIKTDTREIILVGTAHISKESVDETLKTIAEERPDRVCVELDDARLQSINNEKGWQELDITKILKDGKGFLLLANLVLSSFQKRMGADVGSKPGEEMKAAIKASEEASIPVSLVDRPIHVTLQRAWAKNGFIGKMKLLATLISSAFSDEELSAQDIENLKDQGAMDGMMAELATHLPMVKEVLIDERDRYLASKIWEAPGTKTVAVLGAGHLPGAEAYLAKLASGEVTSDTTDISVIPPKTSLSKALGLLVPVLIVAFIAAGFFKGGAQMSADMLLNWLILNSGLAAVGTILALGHPLAVLASILGAPVGTLNPFLAVGLFSGLAQAWAKKPQVKDMETLGTDVMTLKGFYKNRITHVLLVFILSSLGGAIGNFITVPNLIGTLLSK